MSENVKICCSSRPHQAFEEAFAALPGLRLQDLTLPDIRQYIHDKLEKNVRMQRLSDKDPEATKDLIEEIGNAASGVFLWVRLVVLSLLSGLGKYDDIHYLRMRLKELPEELDDLYHHMIFKVDKVYRQEAAQLFQLVGAAYRNQDDVLSSSRATKQLTVLKLSFASDRDTTLALRAKVGFLTREQAVERCKDMEIRLRTRCGGLLEVQYGHRNPQTTMVSPDMTVSYLHRTVKDYLELRETRQKLEDETGGRKKDAFNASHAILKAHLLVLKALESARVVERPPWALTEEAMIWAHRAEQETETAYPEILDEFCNILCHICSDRRFSANRDEFFLRKEPMMTLASQFGLHRYLDAKLSHHNVITGWDHHPSLLDYAMTPHGNWETYISVEVVSVLLKFGAEPNRCEADCSSSPWQSALSYLIDCMDRLSEFDSTKWANIIEKLLNSGVDPHVKCPRPTGFLADRGQKDLDENLWTPDQVFEYFFGNDSKLLGQVQKSLHEAKLTAALLKAAEVQKQGLDEEVMSNSSGLTGFRSRKQDRSEEVRRSSPSAKVLQLRKEKFTDRCRTQ